MQENTTGIDNTASGAYALQLNTTGLDNSASGVAALNSNITGTQNTANGTGALTYNTTGGQNTASGAIALRDTTASGNTANGFGALQNNTTGSTNIAMGFQAALNAPVGNSNSIYIGSEGTGSDSSGTIQIGTQGTQMGGTFIAGISGASTSSGIEVLINSSGQLGTVLSSGRFKEQVSDMGDSSNKLFQLRPVHFFYKPEYDDGTHLLQYGLIAEEVAKVYPEMVAYDRDGRILTVKYQLLAPMLLNELQKQDAQALDLRVQVEQQDETIRQLQARLAALETLLEK